MENKKVELRPDQEYIKLGSLLKYVGAIDKGSDEKSFLTETNVLVNGHKETRRGAKIKLGDEVIVNDELKIKICK